MELKKVIIESLLTLLLIAILIFLIFNLINYFKTNSENVQIISSNNLNISKAYINNNQFVMVITNNKNEEISGVIIKIFNKDGKTYYREFNDKIEGHKSKSLTIDPSPFGAMNNYKLIHVTAKNNLTSLEVALNQNYVLHENLKVITLTPLDEISENNKFDSKKICSSWGSCINNLQERSCVNADFIGKTKETRDCSSEEFQKKSFHDVPIKKDCNPEFECKEWSPCKNYYNLEDITDEKILLNGYRERTCIDKNDCFYEKTEKEPCENSNTFLTKTSTGNIKNIEVMNFYDSNKDEILNLTFDSLGKSLNLNVVFNEIPENQEDNLLNISIYDKRISYSLIIIFLSALIFIIFLIIRFYKRLF